MVREPDATRQPTLQDNQLMSKHRVLSFKPHLRLEWRGQDGQSETEQPDHSANLGDSVTASTRMRFSVHTAGWFSTHSVMNARAPLARPLNRTLASIRDRADSGANRREVVGREI